MPTEKQISANRANAERSTGPKTIAGKLKSSRNAYRHGLSIPSRLSEAQLEKVKVLAHALVGDDASEAHQLAASRLAKALVELALVRTVRTEFFAKIDVTNSSIKIFKRLLDLDRYERVAQTNRKRATSELDNQKFETHFFNKTKPISSSARTISESQSKDEFIPSA
jgi:serine kinase of HPr protein (carbohydrate metabolism regulator)